MERQAGDPPNGSAATAPDRATDPGALPDAGTGAAGPEQDAALPADVPACPEATTPCEAAEDLGERDADRDGEPIRRMAAGGAAFRITMRDGQVGSNAIGGLRAALQSPPGANYDLTILGDGDACSDLGLVSTAGAGEADVLEPAWNTQGPFVRADDRVFTVQVQFVDGDCNAPWELTLTPNPCPAGLGFSNPGTCD